MSRFNKKTPIAWMQEDPRLVMNNEDGSEFVPISVVEDDLTELDPYWSTQDFKFRVIELSGVQYVSSSVVLIVTYEAEPGVQNVRQIRNLVGASTIKVTYDASIENAEAISLSESIKNAAKKLGRRFGRDLNGRADFVRPNKDQIIPSRNVGRRNDAVKMKPDVKIMKKYTEAIQKGNKDEIEKLTSMYDIKTEQNA